MLPAEYEYTYVARATTPGIFLRPAGRVEAMHSSHSSRLSPFLIPTLVITRPRNGEVYLLEPGYDTRTQTLQLSGEVDPVLPEVSWWLDGQKVTAASWPYEANWQMAKGRHHLVMKGGGLQSDPVEFEVK